MITYPSLYPRPISNYRFINNIWGTASDSDLPRRSRLTEPRTVRPLPVVEAWGRRRGIRALFYHPSDHSLPRDRRTDPLGQNTQQSSYQRAHHLQNFHNSGYETSTTSTNYDPFSQDHHKRQHFVRGVIPGGSRNNKMIYGTDELLRQSEEKKRVQAKTDKPDGFLYGTEAATNVGRQKAGTKPNNALWIEARVNDDYHVTRHQKLAKDQDEFLYLHKREKEKQMLERQQEKKKDLDMLQSYYPFQKPGHGAPLAGPDPNKREARRTKNIQGLQEEEYTPLGLGGGGAPNRTVSGNQQTKLRADPELRFPKYGENSNIAEGLRYNKKDMEYAALLEKFINESHTRKQQEEKKRREQEISHNQYDPFKKPGGGAPLKNEQGEVNAKQILTLSTDIKELRGVEPRHQHAYSDPGKCKSDDYAWLNPDSNHWPFGKNTVERDRAGKIMKTKRPAIDDSEGIGIPVGRPGAGAPIKDKDGKLKTRKPQTLTKNSYGQVLSRDFSPKERIENDPFQKPGAGAPIKDADGKVKTRLVAQVERLEPSPRMSFDDIQAKQAYLKTLQDQAEQAEYKRKEENEDLKKSGGDVSSWIRSGVVGQPKFDPVTKEIIASHKTTSDVTQQKLNIRRQKNDTSSNYHRDLQVLVDAKQKQRYQEKETEKHDSVRHVETMNSNWGKKGGGAPLDGYRKQKFGLDPYDETSFRPN